MFGRNRTLMGHNKLGEFVQQVLAAHGFVMCGWKKFDVVIGIANMSVNRIASGMDSSQRVL